MKNGIDRRGFLRNAAAAISHEERALLGWMEGRAPQEEPAGEAREMPRGKIGKLGISRLIVGGNLTSGNAHSRDLLYVSPLVKRYFTDEKIFETWALCEKNGINTAITRLDDQTIRLIHRYWKEKGGKIQWMVQIKPKVRSLEAFKADTKLAVDHGVVGAYVQGSMADEMVKDGCTALIGEALQDIKDRGVIGGIGAHCLEVPVACEKAGFKPDFYMKTLHGSGYWSFNPRGEPWEPFHPISPRSGDNVWCTNPEETVEFMKKVECPWIAFKVLAAGSIPPRQGFRFAFEKGADFACAGLFDFQVQQDAWIVSDLLSGKLERPRPWRA
jgi:hypothetical protein